MSICGMLFQWASTTKIQLSVLVYKVDLIIISLKIILFSPAEKIAELALSNNHSPTLLNSIITYHPLESFWIYSDTCLNRTSTKPKSCINRNLNKVIIQEIFVNLTCTNRTPVYSKHTSWSQEDQCLHCLYRKFITRDFRFVFSESFTMSIGMYTEDETLPVDVRWNYASNIKIN